MRWTTLAVPEPARLSSHFYIASGHTFSANRSQPVYATVEAHSPGAQVIVPPRKVAAPSPTAGTSLTQRDQHIAAIKRDGVFAWKRSSGYYAQSHAENAFSRYKRTFGGHMRAKRDAAQEREAALACELLNRMWELGRPQSYPVG